MTPESTIEVTMPSDREIRVSRVFDAPGRLVFDAHTKPELLKRWAYGPDDWPMVTCEIDLRVGGKLRYIWRNVKAGDMVLNGVYKEIVAPERIVHTEIFEEDWTDGETLVTTRFDEHDGRTTVTSTVLYSSEKARDAALATPMLEGWEQSYERLDMLLESME